MNTITVTAQSLATASQVSSDEKLIEMWLQKNKRDLTVEAYLSAIHRFQHWLDQQGIRGGLSRITAEHLMMYESDLPKHWSDAMKNKNLAALKSLWSFGVKLRYFPFNVAGILTLSKPTPVLPERILSRDEVILAIESEPRLEPALLLCLLFGTGVRCAEALTLNWNDLTEMGGHPKVTIRDGKGGKARVIGCFRSCWDILMEYRHYGTTPLFEVSRRSAFQWVKDAFCRIDKPDVSPHWLRHASAIAMREAGMDWPDIANQLGHSDPSITLKAYSHLTEGNTTVFESL